MKILLVNPHQYNYSGYHNTHTYATDLYNAATLNKEAGHNIDIVDLCPEGKINGVGGVLYFDGIKFVDDTRSERICGNYENEKLFKGVLRCGLPLAILEEKLNSTTYDQIMVCAIGTKTCVTSTSSFYVVTAVNEVVDTCKNIQPNTSVIIIGEYAKICKDKLSDIGADMVVSDPSYGRKFIKTDISLFNEEHMPRRVEIYTSHGCNNGCKFCYIPISEGPIRKEREVADVLDYIKRLVDNGITKLRFMDSDLLSNFNNHLGKILDEIILNKWDLDITSYGGVRPQLLTNEIASKMYSAGFKSINIPLDSLNGDILSMFGDKKTISSWEIAANIAVKYFDTVYSYIMIGIPGQKYEDAVSSISKCEDLGIKVSLLPFTPMPGTEFEDNEKNCEDVHPLLFPYASNDFTVKQIEALLDKYADWYVSNTVNMDTIIPRIRIYHSSKPIFNKK